VVDRYHNVPKQAPGRSGRCHQPLGPHYGADVAPQL